MTRKAYGSKYDSNRQMGAKALTQGEFERITERSHRAKPTRSELTENEKAFRRMRAFSLLLNDKFGGRPIGEGELLLVRKADFAKLANYPDGSPEKELYDISIRKDCDFAEAYYNILKITLYAELYPDLTMKKVVEANATRLEVAAPAAKAAPVPHATVRYGRSITDGGDADSGKNGGRQTLAPAKPASVSRRVGIGRTGGTSAIGRRAISQAVKSEGPMVDADIYTAGGKNDSSLQYERPANGDNAPANLHPAEELFESDIRLLRNRESGTMSTRHIYSEAKSRLTILCFLKHMFGKELHEITPDELRSLSAKKMEETNFRCEHGTIRSVYTSNYISEKAISRGWPKLFVMLSSTRMARGLIPDYFSERGIRERRKCNSSSDVS